MINKFLTYIEVERRYSPRTVEAYRDDLGKILVSGLRDAGTNIVWGKAGKKTAERNKLHFIVGDIDYDTATKAVIAVDNRIKQSLTDSFFRAIQSTEDNFFLIAISHFKNVFTCSL